MVAGFTTENAEFMLEGNDIELACIQDVGRMHVLFYFVVVDLKVNDGWIVVRVATVGHRHD